VLRKGTWRQLPRLHQRALAVYTLSYPFFQALLVPLWPLAVVSVFLLDLPVAVAMVSFLPLYALVFQLVATIVGSWTFAREYGERYPLLLPAKIVATYLPFNILLGVSAVRGVWREIRRQNNWEKTAHSGAHRAPAARPQLVPIANRTLTTAGQGD
jgi:hypothetical protein